MEPAAQAVAVESSPAHTPLISPPGIQPDGTLTAPPPTPDESAPLPPEPFADELPPDFWDDDPVVPAVVPEAPQRALDRYADAAVPAHVSEQAQPKPLTGPLQSDPRFVLLTELFPGHVTAWQSAEPPITAAPDDADGEPETVDLEAGLDADEPD